MDQENMEMEEQGLGDDDSMFRNLPKMQTAAGVDEDDEDINIRVLDDSVFDRQAWDEEETIEGLSNALLQAPNFHDFLFSRHSVQSAFRANTKVLVRARVVALKQTVKQCATEKRDRCTIATVGTVRQEVKAKAHSWSVGSVSGVRSIGDDVLLGKATRKGAAMDVFLYALHNNPAKLQMELYALQTQSMNGRTLAACDIVSYTCKKHSWAVYALAIAVPSCERTFRVQSKVVSNLGANMAVSGMVSLVQQLGELHELGRVHLAISDENLLYHRGQLLLSSFANTQSVWVPLACGVGDSPYYHPELQVKGPLRDRVYVTWFDDLHAVMRWFWKQLKLADALWPPLDRTDLAKNAGLFETDDKIADALRTAHLSEELTSEVLSLFNDISTGVYNDRERSFAPLRLAARATRIADMIEPEESRPSVLPSHPPAIAPNQLVSLSSLVAERWTEPSMDYFASLQRSRKLKEQLLAIPSVPEGRMTSNQRAWAAEVQDKIDAALEEILSQLEGDSEKRELAISEMRRHQLMSQVGRHYPIDKVLATAKRRFLDLHDQECEEHEVHSESPPPPPPPTVATEPPVVSARDVIAFEFYSGISPERLKQVQLSANSFAGWSLRVPRSWIYGGCGSKLCHEDSVVKLFIAHSLCGRWHVLCFASSKPKPKPKPKLGAQKVDPPLPKNPELFVASMVLMRLGIDPPPEVPRFCLPDNYDVQTSVKPWWDVAAATSKRVRSDSMKFCCPFKAIFPLLTHSAD